MYQQRRRNVSNYGILLLAYHLFNVVGIDRIPSATLGIVGLQVAIYLRLFPLPWYKISQVCISVRNVWYREDYIRLIYGALEHGDDMHLYYNMMSFIIKGQTLERRFGKLKFLYLTSAFTVLTSITLVGLNLLALELDYDVGNACAVGFSGVIFALKVLTSYYNPSSNYIMGIPIIMQAKYAVWAELILIQFLVPNASFLGHLAGILVGTAYVYGPLGPILDTIYSAVFSIFDGSPRRRFTPRSEASGYSHSTNNQSSNFSVYGDSAYSGSSSYRNSTYHTYSSYVPNNMSEEEQLRRATEESLQGQEFVNSETNNSRSDFYSNADDIRARRVRYYS